MFPYIFPTFHILEDIPSRKSLQQQFVISSLCYCQSTFLFWTWGFSGISTLSMPSSLQVLFIPRNYFANTLRTPNSLFNKSVFPTATHQWKAAWSRHLSVSPIATIKVVPAIILKLLKRKQFKSMNICFGFLPLETGRSWHYCIVAGKTATPQMHLLVLWIPASMEESPLLTHIRELLLLIQGKAVRRKKKYLGFHMCKLITHDCMKPASVTAIHWGLFVI